MLACAVCLATVFARVPVAHAIEGILSAYPEAAYYRDAGRRASDPTVMRRRLVRVHFDRLAETIVLNLFDGDAYEASLERATPTRTGGYALVGRTRGSAIQNVVLIVENSRMTGNIAQGDRFFQIRYLGNDLHAVYEIDQSVFPPESDPLTIGLPADPPKVQADAAEPDGSPTIDILVVYTPAAGTLVGGGASMNSLIELAVAETNTGYANSGISQRLRLVHTAEVAYDETGFDWSTTLYRLAYPDDGYMDTVHALRDTYGADEVVLLVSNGASCGIGFVMQAVVPEFEQAAFAVVSVYCATGYYSFGHELGHNMGAAHDRAHAGVTGAFAYAYGYQHPDQAWRTVMSYDCPDGCTRINYWSNPDALLGGDPMGVAEGDPNAADNRKTLNNTAATVAAFRSSPLPVADFSGTPASGGAPLIVSFSGTSTGGEPSAWTWDFGDGSFGDSRNPTHVYTQTGAFTVALTAANASGSDEEIKTDYITVSACLEDPVRVDETGYTWIQSAYDDAASGGAIRCHAVAFSENLEMDIEKAVTLAGGCDCSYSAETMGTTLNGSLTISAGSVTVAYLIIQ